MTDQPQKFWLKDPSVLLNLQVVPNADMTVSEKLNAITRALLVGCLGLYILNFKHTGIILGLGLLLIVAVGSQQLNEGFTTNKTALEDGVRNFVPNYDSQPHGPIDQPCWFDQNTYLENAKNEIILPIQHKPADDSKRSYMNAGFELNPQYVLPEFQAQWRSDPSMVGEFTMVPDPMTEFPVEYPEGEQSQTNYIVRSKIDHLPASQSPNGLNSVRAMAEQAYTQASMDFRDGIMNEHIDRFVRERQHNCPDMKLGRVAAGSGGTI